MATIPLPQSAAFSSPRGLIHPKTSVAPPSPSSIHSFDYKMPLSTAISPATTATAPATTPNGIHFPQQKTTPPSTYRKPRSPPLSPTKRKPPPISSPSSPTFPLGIVIPSPVATIATTKTSPSLSSGQLQIPRRQYSDDRFDTVSCSSGSMASGGSPRISYSGRAFGYGGNGSPHEKQHRQQQRSPSPPLILSSLDKNTSSPSLEPSLLSYPTPSHQAKAEISPSFLPFSSTATTPVTATPTLCNGGKKSYGNQTKDTQTTSISPLMTPLRRTTGVSVDPYRSRGVSGLSAKGIKNGVFSYPIF